MLLRRTRYGFFAGLVILGLFVYAAPSRPAEPSNPTPVARTPAAEDSDALWRTTVNDRLKAIDDWRNDEAKRQESEKSSPSGLFQTWTPILLSVASLLLSIFTYRGSGRNIRRAEALARVTAWHAKQPDFENVRWILDNPGSLNEGDQADPRKADLQRVGNWYNSLAIDWMGADTNVLKENELDRMAVLFWRRFQKAKSNAANDPGASEFFGRVENQWAPLSAFYVQYGERWNDDKL